MKNTDRKNNNKKYNISEINNSYFYQIPKWLFTEQYINSSADMKIVYSLLRDRTQLSIKNKWIDENGDVFIQFTRNELQKMIGCGKQKIAKIMKELHDFGLIEEKKLGIGFINRIYLLQPDFVDEDDDNDDQKNPPKHKNGGQEKSLEDKKSEKKNSKKSKTDEEINNNLQEKSEDKNLNNFSKNEKANKKIKYTYKKKNSPNFGINFKKQNDSYSEKNVSEKSYKNILKEKIEYDILKESKNLNTEMLDEIFELMTDVLESKNETINVNSQKMSIQTVKSRFLKLTSDHIKYALECLEKTKTHIRNIRAYLITVVYNSYTSMNSYYRTMFNHDYNNYKLQAAY
jgi:hypothetical protein